MQPVIERGFSGRQFDVAGSRTALDAPDLSDYVAFYWHKVDHWYVDDDEVFTIAAP